MDIKTMSYREHNEFLRDKKKLFEKMQDNVDPRYKARIDKMFDTMYDRMLNLVEKELGDGSKVIEAQNDYLTKVAEYIAQCENNQKRTTTLDELFVEYTSIVDYRRNIFTQLARRSADIYGDALVLMNFYTRRMYSKDYDKRHNISVMYSDYLLDLFESDIMETIDSYVDLTSYIMKETNTLLSNNVFNRDNVFIIPKAKYISSSDIDNDHLDLEQLLDTIFSEDDISSIDDEVEASVVETRTKYKYIDDYKELCSIAEKKGFEYVRSNGDHRIYRHKETFGIVIIPASTLKVGISKKIQRDIDEKCKPKTSKN